jgi:hypothetical protein
MQFGFDFEVVGAVAIWVRDVRGVGAAGLTNSVYFIEIQRIWSGLI